MKTICPIVVVALIAIAAGCSTPMKPMKPAKPVTVVPIEQSRVTREIAAERAQLAKTHVEGALVR